MLKTSAYISILVIAGTLITIGALVIPHVFAGEQEQDLKDDTRLVQRAVQLDVHNRAWQHLTDAQRLALHKPLVDALAPAPTDGFEEPARPDPAQALEGILPTLRYDLTFVVDNTGKVLVNPRSAGPASGLDVSGLPVIKEGLAGMSRDGFWYDQAHNAVFLTAVAPLIHATEAGPQVVGVALVGTQLDSSVAAELAAPLKTFVRAEDTLDIALVRDQRVIATSIGDAELDALVDSLAANVERANLPAEPTVRTTSTTDSNRRVAFTVTSLTATRPQADLGLIVLTSRPPAQTDPLGLALQAFQNPLPEELLLRCGVVAAVGVVLLLFALILSSIDHAAPGRRLLRQLQSIERDIEHTDLDVKALHGVYRDAARALATILTGLRKRLERERMLASNASIPPESLRPAPDRWTPEADDARQEIVLPPGEALDSEKTIDISAGDYARFVATAQDEPTPGAEAHKPTTIPQDATVEEPSPLRHAAAPPAPPAAPPQPPPASSATTAPALTAVPARSTAPALVSALPAGAKISDSHRPVDNTMDMPVEQVKAIMQTLSHEPDTSTHKPTREIPPGEVETLVNADSASLQHEIHYRKRPSSASPAFPSTDPDTGAATRVADDEHSIEAPISGDLSQDSAVAASARATDEPRWRKPDQPLTPQSLLGQLKQRAVVPPKRQPSATSVDEETQVKQVSADLLRRSSELALKQQQQQLQNMSAEKSEYMQLFEDFVSTKEQCGESLDGLTFDRFMGRIERNREKLIEQYACKDVKFQVYVKGGKAALKATPIE